MKKSALSVAEATVQPLRPVAGVAATAAEAEEGGGPRFVANASPGFTDWLAAQRCSLAVSTYQAGKLFFFGVKPDGKLWVFNRTIGKCQGLSVHNSSLWVSADSQIIRFGDAVAGTQTAEQGPDALYMPRTVYYTGDVDAHDMAVAGDGRLVFANTLFSCLAAVSAERSFDVVWKPSFISQLAPEDRCHLNGLALREGAPSCVSILAASDTREGWREQRRDGGRIIDVRSGDTLCEGLSMPHSPRYHGGMLWLHNSGTGEFGYVERPSGRFRPVAFCPGYLRGLSFLDGFAAVGLSKPRASKTLSGLALDAELERRKQPAQCGVRIIDLQSGEAVHWLTIEGVVEELYDVAILPGRVRPAMMGPSTPEARRMIVV